MNAKRIGLALGASLCLAACGELDAGPGRGEPEPKSSLQFDLADSPDFNGNSVWICGERVDELGAPLPADDKYPCLNEVCECFDFAADGGLLECAPRVGFAAERGALEDLCPSSNIPEASWRFRYTIYSESICRGDILNGRGNPNNFACYDSLDLYDRAEPNSSLEWLEPGPNHNEVICLTRNATKTWDFDVCVDETTDREAAAGILRADCGCYAESNNNFNVPESCICGQELGTLPENCTVSPENGCDVLCTPPPSFPACDNPGSCLSHHACDPGSASCLFPLCATTAEGLGVCVEGATACDILAPCTNSFDCRDGAVCVVRSCCEFPVCIPPELFCDGNGLPTTLSAPGGATVGSPAASN